MIIVKLKNGYIKKFEGDVEITFEEDMVIVECVSTIKTRKFDWDSKSFDTFWNDNIESIEGDYESSSKNSK